MEIQHKNTEKTGYFEALDKGISVGRLTYTWHSPTTFIAVGTEVNKEYGGRGVGKRLVFAAVEYAREKGLKIVPQCPFVVALFDKIDAIGDVRSDELPDLSNGATCQL